MLNSLNTLRHISFEEAEKIYGVDTARKDITFNKGFRSCWFCQTEHENTLNMYWVQDTFYKGIINSYCNEACFNLMILQRLGE